MMAIPAFAGNRKDIDTIDNLDDSASEPLRLNAPNIHGLPWGGIKSYGRDVGACRLRLQQDVLDAMGRRAREMVCKQLRRQATLTSFRRDVVTGNLFWE